MDEQSKATFAEEGALLDERVTNQNMQKQLAAQEAELRRTGQELNRVSRELIRVSEELALEVAEHKQTEETT